MAARDPIPSRTLNFDVAVLAMDSTVDAFATPGVFEHRHAPDAADGAERLHRAVLAQAARVTRQASDRPGGLPTREQIPG